MVSENGHDAFVEYEREGSTLAINHTEVPPEIGGRGIAGKLVEAVLRYARDEGLKVLPRCSYADAYMRRHGEYEELRAPG
ncbi:GNAT family N-acetyltransferase [Luteimonas soli]|uniref:GNAT family N-acetyltransferase n=1 Tax=Luteimonas soli TaxID=1648966 RepID=A0ABV7XNV0_9GAMM